MYGDTGWCRSCGAALVPQCGDLVVQGKKFPSAEVWMPNWCFDAFCVSASVAEEIQHRFAVSLRDVLTPRKGPTGVEQMLPALTEPPWHDPADLRRAVLARHGEFHADQAGGVRPMLSAGSGFRSV